MISGCSVVRVGFLNQYAPLSCISSISARIHLNVQIGGICRGTVTHGGQAGSNVVRPGVVGEVVRVVPGRTFLEVREVLLGAAVVPEISVEAAARRGVVIGEKADWCGYVGGYMGVWVYGWVGGWVGG